MNQSKLARLSGFVYLLLICTGIFGLAYVPSSLIVWDIFGVKEQIESNESSQSNIYNEE